MTTTILTGYAEQTLEVAVQTDRPERIHVSLRDANVEKCFFTDRFSTVTGEKTFYIRLPVCGKAAILDVYNERNGNTGKEDSSFKVLSIKRKPLHKKLDVIDMNTDLRMFLTFCIKFCFNAGQLSSGMYKSQQGGFKIDYMPVIVSNNTGKPMSTPARISKKTGVIQVAQQKFIPMTFPMRMAILLHEYSHYYENDDINNETEADLNALLIYLGLGYPRIEAYLAFLDTFIGTPSQENSDRYNIINKFIRDFEQKQMLIHEE